jgi:hypothetical protein
MATSRISLPLSIRLAQHQCRLLPSGARRPGSDAVFDVI